MRTPASHDRIEASRLKIRPPYHLDPSLCLYSPQANRDALGHPRVLAWLRFISSEWEPEPVPGRRVGLLLPCTKYKPYSTSREHRAINAALAAAGWRPEGDSKAPFELARFLDPDEPAELLHEGLLRRGDVWLERIVVSEPLALVPYSFIYEWRGRPSVATCYDDPGLFEARGTSVTPERPDCTAVPTGDGKWRWGPEERRAYVEVHNRLAAVIGESLGRLRGHFHAIAAWVSPGLTHRSFLADAAMRRREGLPLYRQGSEGRLWLRGVLDDHPGLVTVLPTAEQLAVSRSHLAERLGAEGRAASPAGVRAVYARGDGGDTPLGLPEALAHLIAWLDSL